MSTHKTMTGLCTALTLFAGCGPETGQLNGARDPNVTVDVTEASCNAFEDNEGGLFEIRAFAKTSTGREMSLIRRIFPGPDGGFRMEREILVDGELLMLTEAFGDEVGMKIKTEYGPLVGGIESASAHLDGDRITGEVDGRELVPMNMENADASQAKFADGDVAPQLIIESDIETALTEILDAAAEQARDCGALSPPQSPQTAMRMISGGSSDFGHDSDPEASVECVLCWVGCSTAFVGCAAAVSAGCAAAGPFYVVCELIALGACGAAYGLCQYGCYNGGPCCPVSCGDVACCDDNETCLNSNVGLCCSPGKTACVGESCCGSTEVCIGQGQHAGTCCEAENICGDNCCGPLDSCVKHLSLCCPFGQPACGSQCCDSGDVCLGGNFCCPAERACGTQCCPAGSGCDQDTLTCQTCPAGHSWCDEAGKCCPNNEMCSGDCCPVGEYFCNGGCRPIGHCIQ